MITLDTDIQLSKKTLQDFYLITNRILNYLPNILSGYEEKGKYRIYFSQIANQTKYLRPINFELFVHSEDEFSKQFKNFNEIVHTIKNRKVDELNSQKSFIINSTLYTIQQSIGVAFDLLVNPNSARKHVGNRFEELIKVVFKEIGISNKSLTLQIPYETEEGRKIYKCETDLILSPFNDVKSEPKMLDKDEVVVSIKTTSKDRMSKIFIDKILLQKFVGHEQKVIGVFLNDVQRKENNNISFTLVSGLFMVYTKFLTELEGIYYLDLPPNGYIKPLNQYLKPFSDLILKDIWELLPPQ